MCIRDRGEPAVAHVDQENDYKITHLADSFEEFIRGLEHESLYDPDEDCLLYTSGLGQHWCLTSKGSSARSLMG